MDYHILMSKRDFMVAIGNRIRAARERAGFTQEEVAEAVGVSRTAVTRWEQGEIEPQLRNLVAVALKTGVSTDYLLGLDEQQPADCFGLSVKARTLLEGLIIEIRNEKGQK